MYNVIITYRIQIMSIDKSKRFNANLSEKRLEKLRKYSESKDKKMTAVLEDWIDSLPETAV
jgi:hypothetical protein